MEGGWERKRQQEQQRQQKRVSRRSSADVGRFVCGLCFGPSVFCRWQGLSPFVHIEWRRGKVREKKKKVRQPSNSPSLPFRSCAGIDTDRSRARPAIAAGRINRSTDRPTDRHTHTAQQGVNQSKGRAPTKSVGGLGPLHRVVLVCMYSYAQGRPAFQTATDRPSIIFID